MNYKKNKFYQCLVNIKIVYFKSLMKKEKFLFIYKFTLHPQMLKIHRHFYNTPSKCVKNKIQRLSFKSEEEWMDGQKDRHTNGRTDVWSFQTYSKNNGKNNLANTENGNKQ